MRTVTTTVAVLMLAACASDPALRDTTRLGNTYDQRGPYLVRTVVSGTLSLDSLVLVYQPGEGAEVEVEMTEVKAGSRIFEGQIPGFPAFTQLRYRVSGADGDASITDPPDADAGKRFGFWILGLPCSDSIDCNAAEACHLPSGTCREIEGDCSFDRDCGKGRRCDEGRCLLAVRACGSCSLGEVCSPTTTRCIPRPTCEEGFACPIDFACEHTTELCRRLCVDPVECNRGEQCLAGLCRRPR